MVEWSPESASEIASLATLPTYERISTAGLRDQTDDLYRDRGHQQVISTELKARN